MTNPPPVDPTVLGSCTTEGTKGGGGGCREMEQYKGG